MHTSSALPISQPSIGEAASALSKKMWILATNPRHFWTETFQSVTIKEAASVIFISMIPYMAVMFLFILDPGQYYDVALSLTIAPFLTVFGCMMWAVFFYGAMKTSNSADLSYESIGKGMVLIVSLLEPLYTFTLFMDTESAWMVIVPAISLKLYYISTMLKHYVKLQGIYFAGALFVTGFWMAKVLF